MGKKGKFLFAGNWKMNGGTDSTEIEAIAQADCPAGAEWLICPPVHLLALFKAKVGGSLPLGAQDCHEKTAGAFTGDVSAAQLAALGAKAVICGHSERRAAYGESNERVRAKAESVLAAGLHPIICVGESAEDYQAGKTLAVLEKQVKESIPSSSGGGGDRDGGTSAFTLAYEPIWAIGTGVAAQPDDVARAHDHILKIVETRVLYGGSVNQDNSAQLAAIDGVGGFLIGSASLKAQSFLAIVEKCRTLFS